jgi:hypothetical protein
MYSSFKKQKLLTESWRKFIQEASKEEVKHFGGWIDEGYLDSFSAEVSDLWNDPEGYEPQLSILNDDELQFLGNGSFRAVYAVKNDEDYVVKIAFNPEGMTMNKREFDLQQDPSNLFPKVFKHSNNYSWIVMEKMRVIKEAEQFNSFFGHIKELFTELSESESSINFYLVDYFLNPKSDEINSSKSDIGYLDITNKILSLNKEGSSKYNKSPIYLEKIFIPVIESLSQSLGLFKGTKEQAESIKEDLDNLLREPEVFTHLSNLNDSLKQVKISLPLLLAKQLVRYVNKDPLIDKIKRTISKYDIARGEIRVNNTGVNPKGEFRIIDASVRDDINAFMNQPLNPTKKPLSTMAPIMETF